MPTATLEPVALRTLAEFLRDETWVDLRVVDVGVVTRVLIKQINIRLVSEVVVCLQQWLEDEKLQSFARQFDAEDIMSVVPSTTEILDVEKPFEEPVQTEDAQIITAIIRTVAFTDSLKVGDIVCDGTSGSFSQRQHVVKARHKCLILAYNMTDLSVEDVCAALGYKSPQPFHSARQDLERQKPPLLSSALRKIMGVVDTALGTKPRRTEVDRSYRSGALL